MAAVSPAKTDVLWAAVHEARAWVEARREECKPRYGSDMSGLCGIAARVLFCKLRRAGLWPRIAVSSPEPRTQHAFVLAGGRILGSDHDAYVLDVTATQFGGAPVCVLRTQRAWKYPHWRPAEIFDTQIQFVRYQHETRWADYEIKLP